MVSLQKHSTYQLVKKIAVFNLVILAIDVVIVYISAREIEKLYEEVGLQAIYGLGVYFFQLKVAIILVTTLVAFFKFWESKDRPIGKYEKWILRLAFILLIIGTVAAFETFIETLLRFI